jgi:hypothetical protein
MFVTVGEKNRVAELLDRQTLIQSGDVLVNGTGVGTVGRVSLYVSDNVAIPDNHVTIVRQEAIEPEYLAAFLNSRYGQAQLNRRVRGSSGQVELYPGDILDVHIWHGSDALRSAVVETYRSALCRRQESADQLVQAQQLLLKQLGLTNWHPPEPLAYSARSLDALAAKRLDARFFAPRIQALLDILSHDRRTIADVARPRRETFRRDDHEVIQYIEIGDVEGGAADSAPILSVEAPSRATWYVRAGDIITSAVRPIRRLSAEIRPEQDGFVCSSGFIVVEPRSIPVEVLLTYLRLPPICELLDLYASASMYPAITQTDVFNLPMPVISGEASDQIVSLIRQARYAQQRALDLVSLARGAVEEAIETGEESALTSIRGIS